MKEPSRFLFFLPHFSSFFPIFPDFVPLYPDFWQNFRGQGWHSAPVRAPPPPPPPVATPQPPSRFSRDVFLPQRVSLRT